MKLYVGNLNYDTTEDGIKQLFASVGEVKTVNIIRYKDTGKSKGFGFVEFDSDEAGNKAIADLSGKELEGRTITVAVAKPMVKRDGFGGGGGGRSRGSRMMDAKYGE